ncbi:MAG: hypothetical protein ACREM3_22075, partial [Candidatus Rokuibacteriota bacterium]
LRAEALLRRGGYDVDVALLYNTLSFDLAGTLSEAVDRAAGRYEIQAMGQGSRIANRLRYRGVRLAGRWVPLESMSWFDVAGRQSRTELKYDHARRTVEYRYRGETFLLRRQRVVDDLVSIPEGLHVDDVVSAILNYADGVWQPRADGTYHTVVARRRRSESEGPDDVQQHYQAELVPFIMRVGRDAETGKPAASFDLTRFSSWARQSKPARIVFDADRRPQLIAASLILGTSVSIRFTNASS